jgi:hypothetical protein
MGNHLEHMKKTESQVVQNLSVLHLDVSGIFVYSIEKK